jgi:hypothetical protein
MPTLTDVHLLDELDFPASLQETAAAASPSWGVQLFGGARVFGDTQQAALFADTVERLRARL